MPARLSTSLKLRPIRDVAVDSGGFVALSATPWLDLQPLSAFPRGAAVEICYSAGLTDRVARPLLQFRARDGRIWNALMPAPSEGAGFWRGRVPPETAEIRICPTDARGPFHFAVESVRKLSSREMLRLRIASPRRGFFATGARMVRLRDEADLNLRWVLERAETQNFDAWRARRRRAGPAMRKAAAEIAIVVAAPFDRHALARTCDSLSTQTHASWRLLLPGADAAILAWARAQRDARLAGAARFDAGDFVMFLRAGDRLAPHALAAFLAKFARNPAYDIVYSDDLRAGRAGGGADPHFKPDWSPTRQAFSPYVGRAALLRGAVGRRFIGAGGEPQALVDAVLAQAALDHVGHVARALVETIDAAPVPARLNRRSPPRTVGRKVTIVIPTRDKIRLLARCLNSIFAKTGYRDYDVLVVDNGSVEPATLAALEKFKRDEPRLTVAPNPMPFNFSALSNFGAARARGEMLVFLNNDTVVLQSAWLERMLEFATRPDVGAVGCKLLYPTGRVQHAGVVLGMGGVAGHFGEGLGRRARGWLGGSLVPHEVSAVTAACMMIERDKLDAVGGFDAENLPVDLNDIDLCLRLNARGWRTICDCRVMLAHYQSASRGGGALRLQRVYRKEREYFLGEWGDVIRNDPYFNPNLSLYDTEPKLG